ncbi:sugar-binding transcriptional regulator [Lentilactobacillus senioris]|uniref:sugar-binding transcriptional regulator n=1 Tax=Lentilactobacillus senioris TaxID=931534 RepID=UPI003D2AE73E
MSEKLETDKLVQSQEVAELYYQQDLSQAQIASRLGISRPTVSRLLQFARDRGIVKIEIVNPLLDSANLAQRLSQKYGATIKVVPGNPLENTFQNSYGRYAAEFLTTLVKPGDIIGIGWGKTVHLLAENIEEQSVSGVRVVQLKGSVSFSNQKTFAYESANELAAAYHGNPEFLPLPVIFDNRVTKEMVEKDRHINHILELGRNANVAIFTVGTVRTEALIFQLGYFNESEKNELQQLAVGDVCSRFIDANGEIVSTAINERTIGIALDDLKQKEHAMLVATGVAKAAGVHAVLKAGYANCAVIDQLLAQKLVTLD